MAWEGLDSGDVLNKRRTLAEVRKRGRWASEASVRRYEKGARTLALVAGYPFELKEYVREHYHGYPQYSSLLYYLLRPIHMEYVLRVIYDCNPCAQPSSRSTYRRCSHHVVRPRNLHVGPEPPYSLAVQSGVHDHEYR